MNRLTIDDLDQIRALTVEAKCEPESIKYIEKLVNSICQNSTIHTKALTEDEIKQLSIDQMIKFIMILFFLTKNISLEYLRKRKVPFKDHAVLVKEIWNDIEDMLIKKLFLSREISSYFNRLGGKNSKEFIHFIGAAQSIRINDISCAELVSNNKNTTIRLYITENYDFLDGDSPSKTNKTVQETYTLHDRKTCFHTDLYDPFKFEESQTWTAYRYLNHAPKRKIIDSIFTLKFALPELIVLNKNGTFTKISAKDIPAFMERNLKINEIDDQLYQVVKKDYPKLFLKPLDSNCLNTVFKQIEQLIIEGLKSATHINKPLLLLLLEVHGSKESFLLYTMILVIAHNLGINHLMLETINVYHEQYGWDADVKEIKRLIAFAREELGIQVKDLEGKLHYKNKLAPYPYHEIPEEVFGIEAREASWIIDATDLKKNNIMLVGSGHLNTILNSELNTIYYMLPINTSGDKEFSEMLSISQHNFIALDMSVNHLSLNEIIKMIKNVTSLNLP